MNVEEKRIFISDLPETATQTEIENAFNNYGNVTSVEIKERKELGPKNSSLFFAYINIQVNDRDLQQCFKDFSNEKWLGRYVSLQIARESFLDRLKRERESASNTNNVKKLEKVSEAPQQVLRKNISNGIKKEIKRKYKSSTESDSSETDSTKNEDKIEINRTQNITTKEKKIKKSSTDNTEDEISKGINETINLVIKNNKGKVIDKNGLKIESVGNKPIIKIDKSKKVPVNSSEANIKRLQSINNMKKGYQNQKALIKAALSNIDGKSKSKIIFDENVGNASLKISDKVDRQSGLTNIFDDDDSNEDEEFKVNFSLKEQYQGKEGQKLLELQSKYKNDKRFILDERFLDKSETDTGENINDEENEEISLEEEKKKEYEILEQVLGKKIIPRSQKESQSQKKSMLRFDPTQPEHSKFEIKREQGSQKKKKKQDSEVEVLNEKNQEEKEVPVVSKEIFYKVTDNLKENLHVEQGFSLLSMFGQKDEREEEIPDESPKQLGNNTSSVLIGKNPFRYDSSDDEDETEKIPNNQQEVEKSTENVHTNTSKSNFWSESFFFKSDDYKFQDGFDFIEKIKSEDKSEFTKLRRDLKDIVKTKVRNNQRKHKPFKKKLGGNKRKKMIKMKRALKR